MRRARVLIADDDAPVLKSLSVRLEHAGFEVAACRDGYTAALMLDAHPPDLAILDIEMPAGSGFSVHRHMRRSARCSGVPVIYLTGQRRRDVLDTAHSRGPAAVIAKPYEPAELLDAIERCLRSMRRR